jgi:hypothetical protein
VSIGPAVGGVALAGPFSWTPALQGATDNPAPTYTTQQGRWWAFGKAVFVQAQIVTSTMTKTTTTDQVRLSLPLAAANIAGHLSQLVARLENGTAVQNAVIAETTPNAAYLVFRMVPPTSSSSLLTYAVTSLGVLVNTVTLNVSGWYETV